MNTHDIDIELPAEFVSGNSVPVTLATIKRDRMAEILSTAIAPYTQRIAELEAELQELHRQWVEHDTLGCPTAKTGIYASEADRQRRGEPTAAEISDVIREITGCPDIKNGEDLLVVSLGMLFHRCATTQSSEPDYKQLFEQMCERCDALDAKLAEYSEREPVDTDLVQRWQREHGVVLTPGTREAAMVVIRHDEDGKPTVWCDPEIADLVRALNGGGVATVASCSGHGHRPGNIMLADGRVLIVCKDADEAREVESHFPGVNGEEPLAAKPVKVPRPHEFNTGNEKLDTLLDDTYYLVEDGGMDNAIKWHESLKEYLASIEPVRVPSDEEIEELWQQVHQGIPWMSIRKFARALLARYGRNPTIPAGWKLVPAEPTIDMMFMGVSEWAVHDDSEEDVYGIWKAMLAAAPEPPCTL